MKKYIIICLSLLVYGTTLQAQFNQTDMRDQVTAGVKAGLNVSNIWDSQTQDFEADAKAGFAGGVLIAVPIGTYLGFQPEILLSQKGFQGSGTLLGSTYSYSRTTSYIDVPLQLQIKPSSAVTILVGPQYSYLVHQKDAFTFGSGGIVQEEAFDNEDIRKNILGVVGGFDINLSHFVISPRMGWDLMHNNGDGTSSTPRYKNRWVQLTLGVRI